MAGRNSAMIQADGVVRLCIREAAGELSLRMKRHFGWQMPIDDETDLCGIVDASNYQIDKRIMLIEPYAVMTIRVRRRRSESGNWLFQADWRISGFLDGDQIFKLAGDTTFLICGRQKFAVAQTSFRDAKPVASKP